MSVLFEERQVATSIFSHYVISNMVAIATSAACIFQLLCMKSRCLLKQKRLKRDCIKQAFSPFILGSCL